MWLTLWYIIILVTNKQFYTPLKNEFTGEEIRKKIQWYEGNAYIKFEFGGCSRWQEGQEIYCSWYA